jgi:hypothetical protein
MQKLVELMERMKGWAMDDQQAVGISYAFLFRINKLLCHWMLF